MIKKNSKKNKKILLLEIYINLLEEQKDLLNKIINLIENN